MDSKKKTLQKYPSTKEVVVFKITAIIILFIAVKCLLL